MRIIEQREEDDCGIAVAAMLARKPYGKTYRAAKSLGVEESLDGSKLIELLRILTGKRYEMFTWDETLNLYDWCDQEICREGAVLITRQRRSLSGHWVAVRDRKVFDPDYGRVALVDYPNGHWWVKLWIELKKQNGPGG